MAKMKDLYGKTLLDMLKTSEKRENDKIHQEIWGEFKRLGKIYPKEMCVFSKPIAKNTRKHFIENEIAKACRENRELDKRFAKEWSLFETRI